MEDKKTGVVSSIFIILSNLFSLVLLILNIICFINIINHNNSMLLLCTILNIIDLIITGGKGFVILIPFILFNFIYHKNLWLAIQLSLLYENILCYIFVLITAPLGLIGTKKQK